MCGIIGYVGNSGVGTILFEGLRRRAGVCQIGVENAKDDFVAFTDADCIPEKNWLENLVKEFDSNKIIEAIGTMGIKFYLSSIDTYRVSSRTYIIRDSWKGLLSTRR
jgi:cellulose synthase/poly-beta-1,6-N-acetylglucosamine synthase-like glycosyltransferase